MAAPAEQDNEQNALHTKYRPRTLAQIIGHENVVAKLSKIVKTGKYPNAVMFLGPTSAGKTTMARAFVHDAFYGPDSEDTHDLTKHPDYLEINGANQRTIEDIRSLIGISKLRPQKAKRRFILLDEFQRILSNPAAASTALKEIEEPVASTTWLIASMEPDKFNESQNGKGFLNRCLQMPLKPLPVEDMQRVALRIIKGEGLAKLFTKETLALVAEAANSEPRNLANLIQQIDLEYGDSEEKLTADQIGSVQQSAETEDDVTAIKIVGSLLAGKGSAAALAALNVGDVVALSNKMIYAAYFILTNAILKGQRHNKVWGSKGAVALINQLQSAGLEGAALVQAAAIVQEQLILLKAQVMSFSVPEGVVLSNFCFKTAALVKAISK